MNRIPPGDAAEFSQTEQVGGCLLALLGVEGQ